MQSKGPDLELTHNQYDQQEGVNPDREHQDNMEKLPERRHLNHLHKDLLCIPLGKCSPTPLICNTEIMILRYRIPNIIHVFILKHSS